MHNNRIAFSNANFDWSDMMFQQLLHHYRAMHQNTQALRDFTPFSRVMKSHGRGIGSVSHEKGKGQVTSRGEEIGQVTGRVRLAQNEAGLLRTVFKRKDVGQVRPVPQKGNRQRVSANFSVKEDEQVRSGTPEAGLEKIMDTGEEAEQVRSMPETRIPGRETQMVTRTFRDHLVPQESGDGGGLWWWDTFLPLNQAEISECEELYKRGLTNHPLYKNNLLLCKDSSHAGSATTHDLVTMILNLLCNSVLALPSTYCCN
nr:uncharacterized protein LOC128694418 [Cherax quadricarinatus]